MLTQYLKLLNVNKSSNARWLSTNVNKPLFDKILIANRGEIAIRVMKTAKKLGVKTVAVYSEADRFSLHTKMADEAYFIGPAPSSESYLKMDKIIEVAKKSGAKAIHPGYGFLSENAGFAEKLLANELVFIGPPSSAITSMGSKSESKIIMEKAGVPVVPGYHGENQDPEYLKQRANEIGYPVLIKAIKGGGGKGMRIVENSDEFFAMLESSKREGMKSFGDDKVLIEKYLVTPRHVEVQVFGDKFGNAVHLFERDCSVQRRHQKILEEAPAPNLSEEIRRDLGEKAVAAAKAVGYVGAGTVEFIFDNDTNNFYFMEMNTRLQVEHPVTEMITNVDLVQWQLEVAAGNPLPKKQEEIELTGHAFEARIYAENPNKGFLPDVGPLTYLKTPTESKDIRVETGVLQGDQVSVHYDPMIAKLVVRGRDRTEALRILKNCLQEYQIVGLNTNIDFLKNLIQHQAFIDGEVETGFIKKFEKDLFSETQVRPELIIQAAFKLLQNDQLIINNNNTHSNDPYSPFNQMNNFQPNIKKRYSYEFTIEGKEENILKVEAEYDIKTKEYKFTINNDNEIQVIDSVKQIDSQRIEINNQIYKNEVIHLLPNLTKSYHQITVFNENNKLQLNTIPPNYLTNSNSNLNQSSIRAPMPCKITQLLIKQGDQVKEGQSLLVLEAMKMEHVIKAPKDGIVSKLLYPEVGMLVPDNAELVQFED
ncbi:methylcrotonoyl-CoA carboxylase 1 [Neoconidiobolus thromboides FSU 785]|nr:methylcrotonoyl-CoA carboxylase 1 [Neoconidiobolus thromboides FSU 785]